jgi:hypothetical protein
MARLTLILFKTYNIYPGNDEKNTLFDNVFFTIKFSG